jgi:hypothetical protein
MCFRLKCHAHGNLQYIETLYGWIKDKVADKSCILVKISTENNNADIGTKRVPQSLFNVINHRSVDKRNRNKH